MNHISCINVVQIYYSDLTYVLRITDIEQKNNLIYEEFSVQNLNKQVKVLQNQLIPLVKGYGEIIN